MTTDVQTCYRHDDRRAGVRCQRCDRPICPDCMTQASVGFHCPECTRAHSQKVVQARQLGGGGIAGAFRRFPVTAGLVAVNVVVYLLTSASEGLAGPAFEWVRDYALVSRPEFPFGVADGEWYRLVTSGFMHGGIFHLGFNMYILWVLGRQYEHGVGRAVYGAVYGASMLSGSLGVLLLQPEAFTLGASGAVFGLFGFELVGQLRRGMNPMQTGIGGIVALNLLLTFAIPRISIGGHLGGLLGGAVAALVLDVLRRRAQAAGRPVASVLPAAAAAISVLGLACAVVGIVVAGAG